jgi:hypothetical protein
LEPLDPKGTLASLDLLDQWARLVLQVLRDLVDPPEKLVYQEFLGRMESLDLLEREEPRASMDLQGRKVHQVWLDRQDLLESLDLLGNQEYLELRECLASRDDQERLGKRDLLDHRDLRDDLVYLDLLAYPVSPGKEDFLGCQECQVSRVKWGLQDHLDPRETRVLREFLALRVLKELKEELDHPDPQESLEKRVKLACQASQVQLVGMDYLASAGFQESPDLRVTLERMESRERLDHQDQRVTKEARGTLDRLVHLDRGDNEEK